MTPTEVRKAGYVITQDRHIDASNADKPWRIRRLGSDQTLWQCPTRQEAVELLAEELASPDSTWRRED